jgi:hypothetical protein
VHFHVSRTRQRLDNQLVNRRSSRTPICFAVRMHSDRRTRSRAAI